MSTLMFERTLVQAEAWLGNGQRAGVLAETTPVAGLAIIPGSWVEPDATGPANEGEFNGQWLVLHLASGKAVTAGLPGVAQARHHAVLLGELPVDWTAPAEQVTAVDHATHTKISDTWLAAYQFGCDPQEDDDDND
jgi:hypothetical protein